MIDNSTVHQYATWTPEGNGLIIVRKNNIFYLPKMELNDFYQITKNGRDNLIYNGVCNPSYTGI